MNVTFDIETTGLPPKKSDWKIDFMKFPFIVQLSWKRSDKKKPENYIIKPEGYIISQEMTDIHGITTEMAIKKGEYFENVVKLFISDCLKAKYIIGHNIYFDTSIIKANVLRKFKTTAQDVWTNEFKQQMLSSLDKSKRIDTMRKSVQFCKIPFPDRKGFKWASLSELYYILFNEHLEGGHNAEIDVIATEKCFNKLCEFGVITL